MRFEWSLIGHGQIKDYFARAFDAGRIHHAYLFEGPEHVGKATLARIFAKTLLCESNHPEPLLEKEGKRLVPCNICRACIAFEHSSHPDFVPLTVGEESSISIEATREFIHSLTTTALLGSHKVGIVEEAELLTGEAMHALLKTLEEPARGVIIFLISHTPLLETIASRCQRIRFGLVPVEEIMKTVQNREIAGIASGRPGVAMAMQNDKDAFSAYQEKVREISEVFSRDEGGRLLWSAAQFGKGRTAVLRRIELREYLGIAEQVLRDRLIGFDSNDGASEMVAILQRIALARQYLNANVDPQLVSDYLFLGARERKVLYA